MVRTAKVAGPKVVLRDATCDMTALVISRVSQNNSMQQLLGNLYSPFARIQRQWLREMVDTETEPQFLTHGSKTAMREYLRRHDISVPHTDSIDDLKIQVRTLYFANVKRFLDESSALIDTNTGAPDKPCIRTDMEQHVTSVDMLFSFMRKLHSEALLIQLQQLLIILCCHVMHTPEVYGNMVAKHVRSRDHRHLLWACTCET